MNVKNSKGGSDTDMKEVEILLREKANKFDVEMSLRQISVLHKQVRQMIMLMT